MYVRLCSVRPHHSAWSSSAALSRHLGTNVVTFCSRAYISPCIRAGQTGAFAANYEPLRDALAKRGYESVCRSPPSTTLPHGDTDLEADIAFVHNEVFRPLVDQGKEVIILLHSFAGVYGASAVKGLSKSEVSQTGRPGGIIAIVYLAAPCIPSGVSLFQVMGIGPQLLPWVSLDVCTALIPCATILLSVQHKC